ncbi:hypothetical protein U14_05920 [Candidatus Moduliflexus flocculans]|uniref:Uncharacterized protein n=1 Tax=Candidatus Moduliflexus flocculans TaxID=1499966 RepID=A0A081BTA2_9BACT|nr:hypothetical protein U14_05920 [Candidatus Moduliflexus flocculans]
MDTYRKATRKNRIADAVGVTAFFIVVITGASFLLPSRWPEWLGLVIVALTVLAMWHTYNVAYYRCANCGHEFEISALATFFSPHGIGKQSRWKLLKCPKCQTRTQAQILKKS